MASHPRDRFIAALDGLSGLAAREALQEEEIVMQRLRYIMAHRDAGDEALSLLAALGRALLDRKITVIERDEILRKTEALVRALRSAPEVE